MSLAGWTVIVARDDAPDDDLSLALIADGAEVVPLRLMRMEPLAFSLPTGPFDVVAFASRHAVDAVPAELWGRARVAAVGKVTAARLIERGVDVDVIGDAGGAALAGALIKDGVAGLRVLLPRTQEGNTELQHALEEAGAVVVVVDVIRSVPLEVDVAAVFARTQRPRALVLTSPRRARALWERSEIPEDVVVVAIGATTAGELRGAGHRVDAVAAQPGPEGLLEALRERQKNS